MENKKIARHRRMVVRERNAAALRLLELTTELLLLDIMPNDQAAAIAMRVPNKEDYNVPRLAERARKATDSDQPMTLRAMVIEALRSADATGKAGLSPAEIRAYLKNVHGHDAGKSLSPTIWRMWKDLKVIDKDRDTGTYMLPMQPTDAAAKVAHPPQNGAPNSPHWVDD